MYCGLFHGVMGSVKVRNKMFNLRRSDLFFCIILLALLLRLPLLGFNILKAEDGIFYNDVAEKMRADGGYAESSTLSLYPYVFQFLPSLRVLCLA